MSPYELRELLAEIKADVPEINKTICVIDDSQLVNKLQNIIREDNLVLIGVLPSYGSDGRNVDNVKQTTIGQFMVLEKTNYSEISDDEFWDLFQRCYLAIRKVREFIIEKASEGCLPCLANVNINSLDVDPIWKKSECNGYSLDFEIL